MSCEHCVWRDGDGRSVRAVQAVGQGKAVSVMQYTYRNVLPCNFTHIFNILYVYYNLLDVLLPPTGAAAGALLRAGQMLRWLGSSWMWQACTRWSTATARGRSHRHMQCASTCVAGCDEDHDTS